MKQNNKGMKGFAAWAIMLLVMLFNTTRAQAQETTWIEVSDGTALISAIANGAHIRLTSDFNLPKVISINDGYTVTIDLNGNQLDRGLSAATNYGFFFEVKGNLILSNGTISGGWNNLSGGQQDAGCIYINGGTVTLDNVTISNCKGDDGGAIKITENGTLNMNGGSIKSCRSVNHGGGAIVNYGTVNLSGAVSITSNSCNTNGGGIWNNGTLTMKGNIQVKNNTSDNIFLKTGKVITVSGALTGGANSIGVRMESTGTFTSGYSTSGTTPNPFFSGNACFLSEDGGECKLQLGYIDSSWDEANNQVVTTAKPVPDGAKTITSASFSSRKYEMTGWNIVTGTVSHDGIISCEGKEVHLVICDGASLSVETIYVDDGTTLHIYSQSTGDLMGRITCVSNTTHVSGIAVYTHANSDVAKLVIHGGLIRAYGASTGPGIGPVQDIDGGIITILGGKVYGYGGDDAAGIGGGERNDAEVSQVGTINIHGGYVYAKGGDHGAGIGGGQDADGGTVNITGGEVYAYGGTDAAGIGTGEENVLFSISSGTVNISGGYVYAEGKDVGCGIGGGQDADGANVKITGGVVEAKAGSGENTNAIGSNVSGEDHQGKLTFGDNMMVHAGSSANSTSLFTYDLRTSACWYRNYARIEPCNHEGATYTTSANTHTLQCSHCLLRTEEAHTFVNCICTVCQFTIIQEVGDVNGDGDVNTVDLIVLVNILLGKDTVDNYNRDAVDLNSDNNITIADVTTLVNILNEHIPIHNVKW